MTALGGVLCIIIVWAFWAPRDVGEFVASAVDAYEIKRAALIAKREGRP